MSEPSDQISQPPAPDVKEPTELMRAASGGIPVHCCCEPGKRLGWILNPYLVRVGDRRRVIERTCPVTTQRQPSPAPEMRCHEVIELEVRQLVLSSGDVIEAVDSHHMPIERWRRIPGFVEDKGE